MIRMTRKSLKGLAIVAFVALATVSVGAQEQNLPALSAERSQALLSQLEAIDQDRAGFIDQLFAQWAPYVDINKYDLQAELGPIAMKVPAWQLYGASLVGDFRTMMRVLRGELGAGPYINAFEEPQPKMAPASFLDPSDALGSLSDSLVFTPISPCRVVDTRGTGARTGIIAAGAARSFDLTTSAFSSGQGGATSCTGLPGYSYTAWAVNITATGYSDSGWLVAWPYSGTEPTASVLNFGTAIYAIASGQTLTGCTGCIDDVTIRAANAATHVIIDVVGYYRDATVSPAAVTRIAGTPLSIAAGGRAFITSGACPAGTVMIGGENDFSGTDVAIGETRQSTTTTWTMWMINNDGVARTATAYARCMDAPVKVF